MKTELNKFIKRTFFLFIILPLISCDSCPEILFKTDWFVSHLVFKNKDGNPVGDISIALRHDWVGSDEFQCQIKPDNTLYCNGLVVPVGNKIYNKERGAYIFDFDF